MMGYALKFNVSRNKIRDFKGRWGGVASDKFSRVLMSRTQNDQEKETLQHCLPTFFN